MPKSFKWCCGCKDFLRAKYFSPSNFRCGGRCKKCHNLKNKLLRLKNIAIILRDRSTESDISLYQMRVPIEEFNSLLKKQKGVCAVCGTSKVDRKGSSRLSLDHCHRTGKIRGVLCNSCNTGLGYFKDSIPSLRAAIKYLKRFQNAKEAI